MKLTPMFEQYLGIKREYPDALLFYRMGDFYELFFEDAEVAARELQIALTTRNPNAETKVPMCGVPHHSVDAYLSQLLEKGFKVAICDQVEDPRQAKGLVKREVTRVLTPGTVLEDANLEAKRHNYLAALYWDADRSSGGLAWAEFSTGEWSGLQSRKESELWQWARKMQPRELLLPDAYETPPQAAELADDMVQTTRLPGRGAFDQGAARDRLLKAQGVADLSVLDLEDKPELTRACGALLSYLHQTQKRELNHLAPFRPLVLGRHLLLDEVTERNLEIFRRLDGRTGRGTLWKVLDHTLTPMGGRLLQERLRHPWREAGPIQEAQAMTEHFFEADALRGDLRAALDQVYDLERLSTRVFLGRATPKDLVALRRSLDVLPATRSLLSEGTPGRPGSLKNILKHWDDLDDVHALLDASLLDSPPPVITEGGLFKHGFKPELDELLELTEHGEETLRGLLERERQDSGLNKLKLGYNRVFGYYFELPKSQSEDVPYRFIRRQTLANSERFTTPELKELEDKLVAAVDRRKSLEYNLFLELREQVAQARPRLLFMAGVLAGLDFWQSLAEAARRWEWTRPELHAGSEISIQGGRHPVVEAVQGAAHFIPNDLHLDDERKILLITGPNMAGKSTVLRQAAIICILAQIGSFVPARSARIGLADRIFSRVGASDNLAGGQSTFMVEMTETARILRQAGKRSLVILDEIGRGTSTFDGLALAWAVVEELARRGRGHGIRTLFATHYHELTSLEGTVAGVRNLNIAVKEWGGEIVFLRRLVPGPSDRSYGIEVAKLAGVPQAVVQRAREVLAELEDKAREADRHLQRHGAQRSLLPGLAPPQNAPQEGAAAAPGGHPVLHELDSLNPDQLTPMQALSLVHKWKGLLEES